METTPVPQTPPARLMLFLLVVTFLNTIGFTMFLPVLPFIVQTYVRDQNGLAMTVGWLASVYALCQCLAAPALGALSDRYGRRPVLLLCLAGSAAGYVVFGIGGALWLLFAGRIIDGLTGGNFSILSAYIADITAPEERGKFFGRLGAVAGAGFIVGPAIGGFAARLDPNAPAFLAAAITAASLVWGYFFLPESLPPERRAGQISLGDMNLLGQLRAAFALPQLRWLLVATFCFSVPFAMMSSNFGVLVIDTLGWQADTVSFVSLLIGVTDIVMQGLLAERLLPVLGEIRMTVSGLVCEAAAYLVLGAIVLVPSPLFVVAGVVLFAVGTGLVEPASRGLISRAAGPSQQGVVQGGSQSVQSLAMVLGPLLAGALYTQVGPASPLWWGACGVGLAILATLRAAPVLRARPATEPALEA
ncbi:MAG TPA: MFS transporter [Roseiflexaceae bacterium]|nr:MFS transporter [Roseiflexaceae bacterium]